MKVKTKVRIIGIGVLVFDFFIAGVLFAFVIEPPSQTNNQDLPEIIPAQWPSVLGTHQAPTVQILSVFHTKYYTLIENVPTTFEAQAEFGNFSDGAIQSIFVSFQSMLNNSGSRFVSFQTHAGGLNLTRVAGQNYTNDLTESVTFPYAGTFPMFAKVYYINGSGVFSRVLPLNSTVITVEPYSEYLSEQTQTQAYATNAVEVLLTIAIVAFTNVEIYWILQEQLKPPNPPPEVQDQESKLEPN